jgi:hypothetical protein
MRSITIIPRRAATWLLVLLCLAGHASFGQTSPLTAAWLGTINAATLTVSNLPSNGRAAQLLSAVAGPTGATYKVVNAAGQNVPRSTVLTSSHQLVVTVSGTPTSYALVPSGTPLLVENLANVPRSTQATLTNRILNLSGNSEFHITSATNPLSGTIVDMQGDNVWLYFEGIKPSKLIRRILPQILLGGQRAQVDTTVRVVQYLQGSVVISQPSTIQPLQAFTAANSGGNSATYGLYTYYNTPATLGAFDDAIQSFRLRKGYMATLAENANGTGASKVYIAANNDTTIAQLPASLAGKVSMIRVFPWRWVAKKGWSGGTVGQGDSLYVHWSYDWGNNRGATYDQEYVPMRWNGGSPAIATTNAKKNVTHLLGFNEPNSSQQANMSPQTALRAWPALLQSGLRVGSPSPTDGGANWLYQFMDKADSAGYRVDYVALHFYRGCQTVRQFYNFMNAVYLRTKRPIWVTEWNNGANWTSSTGCPKPTYADQATKIQSFITMLDTARFVERYSIYQWVEDTRKMYVTDSDLTSLTPAGIVYRGQRSPMAYNPNLMPPTVTAPPSVPFNAGNLVLTRYGSSSWTGGTTTTLPVYIDEVVPVSGSLYTAGQLVRSIAIPTGAYGANFAYTGSAMRGNADGTIGISPDRTKMAISGFNLPAGNSNANGGSAARVVAVLDDDGSIDTRMGFSDGNNQPLRTATVTDSATVYIAYGANSYGLRHASLPGTVSNTPQTRTGTTIFPTISLKKMAVYEDQLYFTQSTAGQPLVMKLNGLPGTASTPTGLPGIPSMVSGGTQPSGFVMFDVNPNVPGFDLLYYTEDATSSVLNKYSFDGTTWTLRGTYTLAGLNDNTLRDLTGSLVRGYPTLYAVSYTSLVRLEDRAVRYTLANTTFNAAPNITQTILTNNAATSTFAYRGVAFAPGTRDSLYVRVPQTISFAALPAKQVGDIDFTANATTTSGLELGYSSSNPAVAVVNNNLISIVGPGTTQITASQPGNFKYLGATPATRTLTVSGTLATASAQLVQQVALAPNPAHGQVALYLPAALQSEKLTATVLNMLGQSVLTLPLAAGAGNVRTLPLTGLAAGAYLVRLDTTYGTVTKRLLVE